MRQITSLYLLACLLFPMSVQATPDNTQLSVWANEAIVATYSFDYKNYLTQQRSIAKYFTSDGWTQFSNALNKSNLLEAVKSNSYFVSAVATMPPTIKSLGEQQWVATMSLLVVYSNPQYQQKQDLQVSITFSEVQTGGVRGLAINALQSKVINPPCVCKPPEETTPSTSESSPKTGAEQ